MYWNDEDGNTTKELTGWIVTLDVLKWNLVFNISSSLNSWIVTLDVLK